MATDKITFEITWSGDQEAQLYYLMDNGRVVADATSGLIGRGNILVERNVDSSVVHRLDWSLFFPGSTLSELQATARVNGDELRPKSANGDQKHHWVDEVTT